MPKEIFSLIEAFSLADSADTLIAFTTLDQEQKKQDLKNVALSIENLLNSSEVFTKIHSRLQDNFNLKEIVAAQAVALTFSKAIIKLVLNKSSNMQSPATQVYKHQIVDLWGEVLALEVMLKDFIKALCSSDTNNFALQEVAANAEAVSRAAQAAISDIESWAASHAHLSSISILLDYCNLMINNSYSNGLSGQIKRYLESAF